MNKITAVVKGDGLSYMFSGAEEDPITQFHLRTGMFYEQESLRRLVELGLKLSQDLDNFYIVDAGANIGNHSLYFAGLIPRAGIYAFEMNPVAFAFLEDNVRQANLSNIQVFNRGLSSSSGRCGIRSFPDNPLGGSQLDFSAGAERLVEFITLDTWHAKAINTGKCILLKLDVEGHELEVIKGSQALINADHPMIFAELKDIEQFNDVISFLEDLGYVVAYAEKGALPNFLFVHKKILSLLFSNEDLEAIRKDLCARVVDAWQLHRKIKSLLAS